MQYRRARLQGGAYFFTVVTRKRRPIFGCENNINLLRQSFQYVMHNHPFCMDAHVILPDHLHCIWTLPDGERDFSTRWRLIKSHFTQHYKNGGLIELHENGQKATCSGSPWQKKFWEHLIRDEKDMKNHIEYIHYNPVKHGLVASPIEWTLSSIHRYVNNGSYPMDWGTSKPLTWDDGVGRE